MIGTHRDSTDHPLVLFDGHCHLCSRSVQLLLRWDRHGVLRFAPIQSQLGQQLLQSHGLLEQDTIVLIHRESSYTYSAAILRICRLLPWPWKGFSALWLVPAFIRDAGYRAVAKRRFRWWRRRERCMLPDPGFEDRFLN